MKKILEKNSKEICKEMLELLDNNEVKVEVDENEKSSLYVFFTNKIYISTKTKKDRDSEEQAKGNLLVIAHECAHSKQPKFWQLLNFVISNMELLMFAVLLIIKIETNSRLAIFTAIYSIVALLGIFIRVYLETNATINSVKIVSKYLRKNDVDKEDIKKLNKYYIKEIKKTWPLFVTKLVIFRIIRFTAMLAI